MGGKNTQTSIKVGTQDKELEKKKQELTNDESSAILALTQEERQKSQQMNTNKTQSVQSRRGLSVQSSKQSGTSESYMKDPDNWKELQGEHQREWIKTHPGYKIDDDGNIVRDSALFDALQVDREKLRGERERQERLERLKKIESALANSSMLISDMVSAGIGGNVYKRENDKTIVNANKEIARLREAQIADDIANKEKDEQEQNKWSAALWDAMDKYHQQMQHRINKNDSNSNQTSDQRTLNKGNQLTTETSVGQTSITDGKDFKNISSGYNGYGSGQTETVKVRTSNGTVDIHMPKRDYESTGRYLSALYNELSKAEGSNINQVLANAGIKKKRDGTYDGADLLSSGIVFDNPQVSFEFVKAIYNDKTISTEDKISIIKDIQYAESVTSKEKKRKWYQKIADWFREREQGAGAKTSGKIKLEW